jgi:hypothetical protein
MLVKKSSSCLVVLHTAAPYWVEKPQSVDVGENDTAKFTCEGEGLPAPTYFWFINGVPITSNFAFFTHLQIATLSLKCFQCVCYLLVI